MLGSLCIRVFFEKLMLNPKLDGCHKCVDGDIESYAVLVYMACYAKYGGLLSKGPELARE